MTDSSACCTVKADASLPLVPQIFCPQSDDRLLIAQERATLILQAFKQPPESPVGDTKMRPHSALTKTGSQ
jgi:hypothetical protein